MANLETSRARILFYFIEGKKAQREEQAIYEKDMKGKGKSDA